MKYIHEIIGLCAFGPGKSAGSVAGVELTTDLKKVDGFWIDEGICGRRYVKSDHARLLDDRLEADARMRLKGKPEGIFLVR